MVDMLDIAVQSVIKTTRGTNSFRLPLITKVYIFLRTTVLERSVAASRIALTYSYPWKSIYIFNISNSMGFILDTACFPGTI